MKQEGAGLTMLGGKGMNEDMESDNQQLMVRSFGYDGKLWVLVDPSTQKRVLRGDTRATFRGEIAVVTGGRAPHKPGSTGRIYTSNGEYFPSVYGTQWVHPLWQGEKV